MRVVEQIDILHTLFDKGMKHLLGEDKTIYLGSHPLLEILVEGFDWIGIVDDEILVQVILVTGDEQDKVHPLLPRQVDQLPITVHNRQLLVGSEVKAHVHIIFIEIEHIGLLAAKHGA